MNGSGTGRAGGASVSHMKGGKGWAGNDKGRAF
jgi:hypothetical protein